MENGQKDGVLVVSRYNPNIHHRRSIRLEGYDYAQAGAYFVTICAHARECLFGQIAADAMALNEFGEIVRDEWLRSSEIRSEIRPDEYIIMPNHFHGIIFIVPADPIRRGDRPVAPIGPKPKSLGAFMAGFKSAVTKRINEMRRTPGATVWQRNYYEHIIRNEADYNRIAEYINHNPQRWAQDSLNPMCTTVLAGTTGVAGATADAAGVAGVGATGVGATGVGATGVGATGVGAAGVGAAGVGATGVGATGVGATGRSPLRKTRHNRDQK